MSTAHTTVRSTDFRIEWDLRELGPRPASEPAYRDVSAGLDFSRLDYARAVAAGYLPANEQRLHEEQAA